MRTPINILIVEDSADDSTLLVEALKRAGFEPNWTRVETEAAFRAELKNAPDVILSDYRMPQFSGPRALQILKEHAADTPFILVSGTVGEEAAVEAMKLGVTDYLLKDRIARLGSAVERALEQRRLRIERQRAEQQIHLQANALEAAANAILITDRAGTILSANTACCTLTGYAREELIGQNPRLLKSGKHEAAFYRAMWETIGNGRVWQGDIVNRRKDGTLYHEEMTITPVRGGNGQTTHFITIKQDLTERRQTEEAMRASEAKFRQLAENIHEVFWMTNPQNSNIDYVSPAYETIWGRTCESLYASPRTWLDAIHPEDRERVQLATMTKQVRGEYDETYRITRPDGSVRWIHDRGFPVRNAAGEVCRVVGTAEDITERLNLEAQLLQAQKMEAIGQLAAGVAHDFNNLLTVIRGNAELVLFDAAQFNEQTRESLGQINAAVERAANLTRQLLTFGRKQIMQPRLLDLNEVVGNMTRMLKRIIGEDISLTVSYDSNLPTIVADVGMMEQVVMNLAVNARDAMPGGGQLHLGTTDEQIGEEYVHVNPQAAVGNYVCLCVTDTGHGIPPEILPRVFEPFFTTKAIGKGTGLGLATVYGIVRQHRGWITVYSEMGRGAAFRVYLPVANVGEQDAARRLTESDVRGGTEIILLAEDDSPVRALMRNVLERYGYEVVEADTGVEALKRWRERDGKIDLLLTDMVMPDGMNGRELAEQIRAEKPALPVIYTSGYSADLVGRDFELQDGVNFVQKPCSPRRLAQTVRHCLDGVR